jgi:hypothetical protein
MRKERKNKREEGKCRGRSQERKKKGVEEKAGKKR